MKPSTVISRCILHPSQILNSEAIKVSSYFSNTLVVAEEKHLLYHQRKSFTSFLNQVKTLTLHSRPWCIFFSVAPRITSTYTLFQSEMVSVYVPMNCPSVLLYTLIFPYQRINSTICGQVLCVFQGSIQNIIFPYLKSSMHACSVISVVSDSLDPMDCSLPGSSVMGFSRQEYWRGLPFPSPGDLPDPGIEPVSPALAGGFFTTESPGKSFYT